MLRALHRMLSTAQRSLLIAVIGTAMIPLLALAQPAGTDVAVSKSGPDIAAANSDVSYSVTVANVGSDDALFVSLNDAIPAGMTFVSATQNSGPAFSCSAPAVGSGGTVSCSIASLTLGSSATFTFVFHIPTGTPPGTLFVNIATVSSETPDENSENDSAVVGTSTPPPPQSDLVAGKSGPTSAGPDTDVVFAISISNAGPDAASSATLQDLLPGTMTFVSLVQTGGPAMTCGTPAVGSGGTVTCTASPFAAGTTASFNLTTHIPPATPGGTSFTNTVTVSTANDPNPENNDASSSVVVASADLSITKTGPPAALAGTNISYTITVTNGGPDPGDNVTLTDTLPPGTTFVSITQDSGPPAACSTSGATLTCTIDTLGSTTSAQFTLVINAGGSPSITNTASVSADSFDPSGANNSSGVTTTLTPVADVAVTKSGPPTVTAGSNVTYTVTVTNNGPSAAASVSLTDAVPANSTFVSANQTSGPTFSCTTPAVGASGTITCNIASLASAASATFSFVFNVATSATGSITNNANVTTTTTDPTPANNAATAITPIGLIMTDVGIAKTANSSLFGAGSTATFTIVVTNNGPNTASGTTVTDVLPAGTTFNSSSSTQGTCSGTSTVTCAIGTLAASGSATITIVVTLPMTAGPVSNTATVTISNADTNPANNSSTVIVTVFVGDIPALSPLALALLGFTLAAVALFVQRLR